MSLYLGNNCISAGGSSAFRNTNIGEIIQSTIPLTDAGLHLLDGALINGSGSYADFVTYIAGLVSTYPDLFTTEANWQSSVTTYGVCGKFVYDSVNNTVRLPKITGFTEGTIDPTVLGDLVAAGLPNITGNAVSSQHLDSDLIPFDSSGLLIGYPSASTSGAQTTLRRGVFSASNVNSIYGNSANVQPQSIKVLYYVVIATSVKTQIEVDIDEIATDLNGKADVDLSNMNPTEAVKGTIVGWGMPDWSSAVTISRSTMLSGYTCPSDGIVCGRYNPTNANSYIKVNDVWVSGGDNEITPLFSLVNKNDVVTAGSMDSTYWNISFVPLKGV